MYIFWYLPVHLIKREKNIYARYYANIVHILNIHVCTNYLFKKNDILQSVI